MVSEKEGGCAMKFKQLFTNWRVLLLLFCLVLAVVSIHPSLFSEGLAIKTVVRNSSAAIAGVESPKQAAQPTARERILSFNNIEIKSFEDYNRALTSLQAGQSYTLLTNKGSYAIVPKPIIEIVELNETEIILVNETVEVTEILNGTEVPGMKNVTRERVVPKIERRILGVQDIGLRVERAARTNLHKGLDLQGGTRVLLQPEQEVSPDDMEYILESMSERLNVYGLSDVRVVKAGDLTGQQYIIVEIAGATEEEVKDLLAKQGKFEAKVANDTVFIGGQRDVTYVCRSADCSGIDVRGGGCGAVTEGVACRFFFTITLSKDAADRQAAATQKLGVIMLDPSTGQPVPKGDQYLDQPLELILDDQVVDTLSIAADLKGKAVTDIQISGSGVGSNELEAREQSLKNMKRLQTIMLTGSLPVKLNIVKTDTISPVLGEEFVKNALLLAVISLSIVVAWILVRYRSLKIAIPILITCFSEIVLILGFASLTRQNLDLAAIAGIIIAIGTGVDHQIVITDETLTGQSSGSTGDWVRRLKGAFLIIMIAYFTTVSAMFPLLVAGAGLLKGLAVTTIAGFTVGILISRPAFAAMIQILTRE